MTETNWQILLDMDGVLADFVGGIARAHGRPDPYTSKSSFGVFDIERLWGMTSKEFWFPADSLEFWAGLSPTPEAFPLVSLCQSLVGRHNIAILTSPSSSVQCIPGKRQWIDRYFPQYASRMIFGSAKQFLAAPHRILIDDRDSNVDSFIMAGGPAILLPRLWNRKWDRASTPLERIEGDLCAIMGQPRRV